MDNDLTFINNNLPNMAAHLFVPERLTLAREWKGLSKAQLAMRLDKTASSISQLESGKIRPDPKTITKIAFSLGIPLTFFTKKLNGSLLSIEDAHFRSLRSATQIQRKMLLGKGTIACELLNLCEKYINFPHEQITHLSKYVSTNEDIEKFSLEVRSSWNLGLGPISNVIQLLESKGVVVLKIPDLFHEIGAFSTWYGNRPFIFLLDKDSTSKTRFDAIHELGHLLMHADVRPGDPNLEREANRFASAFLCPTPSFSQECPKRLNLDHFFELKQRWKVPIKSLVRRAFELNLISEASYRRAFIQLNLKLQGKDELHEPSQESPTILKQALNLLTNQITLKEIVESQGISVSDLENIILNIN